MIENLPPETPEEPAPGESNKSLSWTTHWQRITREHKLRHTRAQYSALLSGNIAGSSGYGWHVATATLREVRLTSFKSFRDQVLPIEAITVLTGLNSSGKSNALDAIEVLTRLAGGEDLRDALDGRKREAGTVRGGSIGCAPHGSDEFALGCTVEFQDELYLLDLRIEVRPELRIVEEHLRGPGDMASGKRWYVELLTTRQPDGPILGVEVFNGKPGPNPTEFFRDSRLVTAQAAMALKPETPSAQSVVDGASIVISALRGVFHLDPVPHLMRGYVPGRDTELRRTGENLSAALRRLEREENNVFSQVVGLIRAVGGDGIHNVRITGSELGDVMLALEEQYGAGPTQLTPAREMSDGLLRFAAIATALLTATRGLDIANELPDIPSVLLVLEELENGLHPSQSGRVLRLLQSVSENMATQVLFTSHSPALLNELTGTLNTGVVVCHRTEDGHTELTRLVDLDGFAEAMAAGRLGDLVSSGRMVRPEHRDVDMAAVERLFGGDQ
ncbi:AAA family ATPase [Nocardia sp. NPDC059177]|uniref:AAA family ATPase n=1 Tax=Nocardia sp. NPDC059177 TaxID=3346759 RepID=UPI0036A0D51E